MVVDWMENPEVSRVTGNRKAVRTYNLKDLKTRLSSLLSSGFKIADLEDGTAALTRAQRSLLMPIRTAYHKFLQHYRDRVCYLDTMTLLNVDDRTSKGSIVMTFEKMGLRVKRVFRLCWGSESKKGWCHVQFHNNDDTVAALKVDFTRPDPLQDGLVQSHCCVHYIRSEPERADMFTGWSATFMIAEAFDAISGRIKEQDK